MYARQRVAFSGLIRFSEEVGGKALGLGSEAVAVAQLASRWAQNSLWSWPSGSPYLRYGKVQYLRGRLYQRQIAQLPLREPWVQRVLRVVWVLLGWELLLGQVHEQVLRDARTRASLTRHTTVQVRPSKYITYPVPKLLPL